jgi:hypothetical protein
MVLQAGSKQNCEDAPSSVGKPPNSFGQAMHDLNNHLGVISLGIDGIECGDQTDVRELCQLVRMEGIEPMRLLLAQLQELSARQKRDC